MFGFYRVRLATARGYNCAGLLRYYCVGLLLQSPSLVCLLSLVPVSCVCFVSSVVCCLSRLPRLSRSVGTDLETDVEADLVISETGVEADQPS